MGDVNNHYESLDRSLKKMGIVLVDDLGLLRNGKASQCLDLLRRLLLSTSVTVAKQLLSRGCPSHASDKKLVAAAFELIRDKVKFIPSLTVDQFFKEGFAAHKLAILVKLSGYIAETDKSFQKAPPAKIMYVVPVDVNLNNTADLNPDNEDGANNEDSTLDDTNGYGTPTHALPSPPRAVVAPPKEPEWPQTDFIKKHILDNNKLRSATKASAASPASRTLSRNASTPSSKSRSTTPTSVRHSGSFRRDDSGALNGIDIYDIEEKTAALEAIQALRAQRQGIAAPSPRQLDSQQQNASQASSSAQYNSFSGNSLTELAATEARGSFGCIPSAGGLSTAYSRPALSPQRSAEGSSLGVSPKNSAQSGTSTPRNFGTGNSGANNNSVANNSGASAVQLNPNSDFAVFIQQTVDAAVQQRLSNDPELQKTIEARVEAVVEQRVQAAVADITTKYDFIINKLVAAVDAEFTLLNNKLAMQQQGNIEHQY